MVQIKKAGIGLILTLDYEIHGNGSGDFENWVYFPTAQMLDLFDTFGAKLTIMAEMGHYWAMKKYKDLFSKDIYLFETQLRNAVIRGHDVQLHFHPQWIDAEYKDGNWNLDYSRKSIERLCHNYDEAYFYLKKGKEELQNLLSPVNHKYQCVCFRAGFFQMQPSEIMIKALEDIGFLSDSSVSKGYKTNNNLGVLDYTYACSNYRPWKISKYDICKNDESGKIIEFPILADRIGFINKLLNKIIYDTQGWIIRDVKSNIKIYFDKGMTVNRIKKMFADKFKRILFKSWEVADFCRKDRSSLLKYIRNVLSLWRKNDNNNYIPVVLIGHSKDFFSIDSLSRFLKACQNIEEVEFTTYFKAIMKLYPSS